MRITQEELQRRLKENKLNVILRPRVHEKVEGNEKGAGRIPDKPNAPKSLREIAAVTSKVNGNCAATAGELGLTAEQVRYASGTKLTEEKVRDVALSRLMDSLGLLTPQSISDEKPKDIASIAANLSRVHKNLSPDRSESGARVNIMIYSPERKKVEDYEVIDVAS